MNQDRFWPGLVAILMISAVLFMWMAWFFFGRLAVYATSVDYQIRDDGMLLGTFTGDTQAMLLPGQQAELVFPHLDANSPEPLKAEVMDVPAAGKGPVEIYLFSSDLPADLPKGQLKVMLGYTSPAALVWDSIQK